MTRTLWHDRWEQGRISFHKSDFNANLLEHWSDIATNPKANVFVPLCGKTRDMVWLAQQGHSVTGCELVELGVKAFFDDNLLTAEVTEQAELKLWQHAPFAIYQGDYFKIPKSAVDAEYLYDRAALIALPKPMRAQYAEQLTKIAPNLKSGLLITLEFDDSHYDGPPFSVPENEVIELFNSEFDIEIVARHVTTDKPPIMRERNIEPVEIVYKLVRKA